MLNQSQITGLQQHPTPFYAYDLEHLRKTLEAAKNASSPYKYHVHYAFKANVDLKVLGAIRDFGFGADCVSGNEVKRAVETGFKSTNIVFAGVGKNDDEIRYALNQDIFCFNCESLPEMEVINQIASERAQKARVALRINPNVHANTHHYITTGLEENKFGISIHELPEVLEAMKELTNLELIGIHFHIGSQITDLGVFRQLCTRVNEIQEWFASRRVNLKVINVGGGLGVNYHDPEANLIPDFKSYFDIFPKFLQVRPDRKSVV